MRSHRRGAICNPSELKRVSTPLSSELKNITATVKWFKVDKGYGFVRFIDGSGEAFIHASAIAPLGDVVLAEGMTIVCDVAEGQRGPQVGLVHRVEPAAPKDAVPAERKRPARQRVRSSGPDSVPAADLHTPVPQRKAPSRKPEPTAPAEPRELMLGTVRWYNLQSQSGIIDPYDDAFPEGVLFDRATLRLSGLEIVADGEDVWFTAYGTLDGAVADHVQLAPVT